MREIGRIKHLQIQRSSLKVGAPEYYDPAALLPVEQIMLTPAGVVGIAANGERLIDVHHLEHPASKSRKASNALSLCFTSHYAQMRDRFGAHLHDGSAGENILVETEHAFTLDDLGQALVITHADQENVQLAKLLVAHPCVPFSHFANRSANKLASADLRATLQFLDHGRRGFYAQLAAGQTDAVISVGDLLLAAQ